MRFSPPCRQFLLFEKRGALFIVETAQYALHIGEYIHGAAYIAGVVEYVYSGKRQFVADFPRPNTLNIFSIRTAARSALCPFPVM